jgi:hypothetical protein
MLLAAFAAIMLWGSAVFAQQAPIRLTATTPCVEVLRPSQTPNLVEVRRLIAEGQAALIALPTSVTDASALASREAVRATFERARSLSNGDLMVVYSEATALRRMGINEVSIHEFECLRDAPGFAVLPQQVRDATTSSISALQRDIDAARRAATTQPPIGPDPVVTPPGPRIVGPDPRVAPPIARRTPHPRSPAMRTAGRVLTGAGAATFVAGVVTTVLCAADVNGDRSYLDDANRGAPHGWSDGRAERLDQLCLAGPIMMGVGAAVGGTGAVLWRIGGQQVTDPEPPPPIRTGTNGIPIISFAPSSGGGQASATWRF